MNVELGVSTKQNTTDTTLSVFEKSLLRKIFDFKREKATEER